MTDSTALDKRRAIGRASYHRHKQPPILSDHLCECGCGQFTYVAPRTSAEKGWVKGEPKRFVHGHNRRRHREPPQTVVCRLCNVEQTRDSFYVDASRPTGLSSACKECLKAQTRAKYKKDPEPFLAQSKQWRKDNRQRARENGKSTRYRRRARLKNAVVEKIDPVEIYKRDGWKCHICGKRVAQKDASLDHLIPISKGGDHVRLNVRLAHVYCNVKRGAGRIPAQLLLH